MRGGDAEHHRGTHYMFLFYGKGPENVAKACVVEAGTYHSFVVPCGVWPGYTNLKEGFI